LKVKGDPVPDAFSKAPVDATETCLVLDTRAAYKGLWQLQNMVQILSIRVGVMVECVA
jgi:hypothetical protein